MPRPAGLATPAPTARAATAALRVGGHSAANTRACTALLVWACVLAWLVSGCAQAPRAEALERDTPRSEPVACNKLARALSKRWPRLSLDRAERVSADNAGHPRHCRLQGVLAAQPASAKNGPAHGDIGFEMRLPEGWNGRFLHQANGGTDGVLQPAYGTLAVLDEDALRRGFAVLSSDGGHRADDPQRAGAALARGLAFGLDPQARRDMGHQAMDSLWPLAQAVIQLHYGRPAAKNYLAGCGNGGRLGLVAASSDKAPYDGILAGAPALYWPGAALQHPWDHQQWRTVKADTRQALSAQDLHFVAEQVVARCDALDMAADGMVNNLARCQAVFQPASLQCKNASGPDPDSGPGPGPSAVPGQARHCLSAPQVQALQQVMAGPRNSAGLALYTDWPYDGGLGSERWRRWRVASDFSGWQQQPIGAIVGGASLAFVFSTPPQPVPGTVPALLRYLQNFNFDTLAPGASGVTGVTAAPTAPGAAAWPMSASAPVAAAPSAAAAAPARAVQASPFSPADEHSPRLAALERRGGKLIVYHGSSDPAFSANATLGWAERLHSKLGLARAQAMARVFAVPGMGHCHGGPATDRFDALAALVDWVEQGKPPEQLHAQVDANNPELPSAWARHRSRPLCPWPQIARYRGGDVESAASFRCAMP